ncbi:MAG TPA: phosphatidylserine decarboxylase, partial [Verrucomicrobiota bacterium]|nr:phosphatidylserine decarboxylase [Verrucomicrobiota bacterium]
MTKNKGKARQAAFRLIRWTLTVLLLVLGGGVAATLIGSLLAGLAAAFIGLWFLFALFVFYFFRDPNPVVPATPNVWIAPAHGKVDLVDQVDEPEFMGGPCRRVSIFLSIFNVHVQYAPAASQVTWVKQRSGQFMNAMNTQAATVNENVYLGLESLENPGEKIGVRLIVGMIARRIVPWVNVGETVQRGERISIIQFGSR